MSKIDSLPPRQKEVIRLIISLTQEHGYPPSLADLADGLGLRNRMTVHQHVTALKKKGMVQWEPGLNRSLRLSPEVQAELSGDEDEQADVTNINKLPLVGTIAAGRPIDALEHKEYIEFENQYAQIGCYALKVKGDSMIEDGIFDGDFVIIKPNPSPTNGDIVVALLDDGIATLKHFYKEKGRIRLQPANESLQPIYVEPGQPIEIQGTLVGLFRKFH